MSTIHVEDTQVYFARETGCAPRGELHVAGVLQLTEVPYKCIRLKLGNPEVAIALNVRRM